MPVPSVITDLNNVASLNSPAGSESVVTMDDYLRAHAAFIRKLYDDAINDRNNLGDASAYYNGPALIGFNSALAYPAGTLGDVLRSLTFQSYTALRAYTGSAGFARITGSGIAGDFSIDSADTTSADNGGTIIVDASGRRWKRQWTGTPTVEWWGVATSQSLSGADSVADSYSAFASLLAWCSSINYGGTIRIGRGYYRLSQPLDVTISAVFEGCGKGESYIHADHTAGPAIRFRQGASGVRNLGVTASATRRAAAYGAGLNFGILFEGDDVAEAGGPRLLHCLLDDFYVYGHPQGAVHIVGPAFTGRISGCEISLTKGHGISFDRGEATGRTNLITGVISGICRIGEGRISNCGGHAIAAGSPTSNFSTPALRIVIDNIEGGSNATDTWVRFFNSPVFLRGANFVYMNSGLSVNAGGSSAVVAGRNIHLRNNRMLGDYSYAYQVVSYDELPTDGVFIEGMSIISPAASLNPAVLVSLPAGEVIEPQGIHIRQGESGNITSMIATDASMGSGDFRRIARLTINGDTPVSYKTSNTVVNNSTTLVADPDLRAWLAANEVVTFECVVEYDGTQTADIRMQVVGPSGSTTRYAAGPSSLKVNDADAATVQGVATTLIYGTGGVGNSRVVTITGVCQNGSTAGYLGLRFAQSIAEASDTRVLAGISHLRIQRVTA